MGIKIKPGFGIGSEGISLGVKVTWEHDNHRQRQQRARRYASRVAHGKLPRGAMSAAPAEQLPNDWEYDVYRPNARVYKFPSRDPNKYEGSQWEKVLRGAPDYPPISRVIERSLYSIWWVIMGAWINGAFEADEETKHRWDLPDPQRGWKNLPGNRPRSPTQVFPKEWQPPPKVLDELSVEVGRALGKIRIGSVSIGDEGVLWDPQVWPGPVAMPKAGGVIVAQPQQRGVEKKPMIVVRPVAKPVPVPVPVPAPLPAPQALPTPAPLPGPLPRPGVLPKAAPWLNPWLYTTIGVAVSVIPTEFPEWRIRTQTVEGVNPELRFQAQPVPRPWLARSGRLAKDVQAHSDLKYLAISKFVDRVWSTASNTLEIGEAILQSTHGTDGKSAKYGYKRWDRWLHDVSRGTAQVDYQELLVALLMNEVEDRTIAFINKKKLQSLAKAGNSELDKELRAMNQLYTRMAGQLGGF